MAEPPNKKKISLLFIGAEPVDRVRLELTQEFEGLAEEFERWAPDRFRIISRWGVSATKILELLEDYQPDALHFSGHGLHSGELAFEDNERRTHAPPPEAVAKVFELYDGHVRCVVLNACHAAKSQAQLIAKHADVVIGVSDEVLDKEALVFSRALLREFAPLCQQG